MNEIRAVWEGKDVTGNFKKHFYLILGSVIVKIVY